MPPIFPAAPLAGFVEVVTCPPCCSQTASWNEDITMNQHPDDLLTPSDAARVLGLSADSVRVLSDNGRLPSMRTVSGRRLFRRSDVDRLAIQRAQSLSTSHGGGATAAYHGGLSLGSCAGERGSSGVRRHRKQVHPTRRPVPGPNGPGVTGRLRGAPSAACWPRSGPRGRGISLSGCASTRRMTAARHQRQDGRKNGHVPGRPRGDARHRG